MTKDQLAFVKDAVHKLQLFLLDGCKNENQLFAAGSVISRDDYYDVVTERTLSNVCGYPLCANLLRSDRPRKGRYRISLKDHKVYDLNETYMYCSETCLVNSRTFGESLHEERCSVINTSKLKDILRSFDDFQVDSEDLGENGNLDISRLSLHQKDETSVSTKEFETWAGPSNAIEGYVPLRGQSQKHSTANRKVAEKSESAARLFSGIDFMSSVIISDEYSISKSPPNNSDKVSNQQSEEGKRKTQKKRSKVKIVTPLEHDSSSKDVIVDKVSDGKASSSSIKSSLKPPGTKKGNHSVSWEDKVTGGGTKKNLSLGSQNLITAPHNQYKENDTLLNNSPEISSKPICDSGTDKSTTATSPCPSKEEKLLASAIFDPDCSWYDVPPEDFCLILSPFATTWDTLFRWITSSSLAFIYGKDEFFHEDFMFINGREYPRKSMLEDGRSLEINQTVASFISRSLPGLVSDLNISVPISTIEKAMNQLLRTMSFVDALPALRMKQWQVLSLLFLEALSIYRVPVLASKFSNSKAYLHKVLNGAMIQPEEYEILKDLLLPLGNNLTEISNMPSS